MIQSSETKARVGFSVAKHEKCGLVSGTEFFFNLGAFKLKDTLQNYNFSKDFE